jgi:hypothetical protein
MGPAWAPPYQPIEGDIFVGPRTAQTLTDAYEIGGESAGTDTCPVDPCSTFIETEN